MDDVLPWPTPDWERPQPYDGPTPEEVVVFRQLRATADGIRAWVTGAYLVGTTPEAWRALAGRLAEIADMCAQHGRLTIQGDPVVVEADTEGVTE